MTDQSSIHEILESLMLFSGELQDSEGIYLPDISGVLERHIIPISSVKRTRLLEVLYDAILTGDT